MPPAVTTFGKVLAIALALPDLTGLLACANPQIRRYTPVSVGPRSAPGAPANRSLPSNSATSPSSTRTSSSPSTHGQGGPLTALVRGTSR